MISKRRFTLAVASIAALAALPAVASAQGTWPTRPVTLVSPYAPGGAQDIMWRVLAPELSERWKQPVVVENRPGAGNLIGMAAVKKADPDGYTLLGYNQTLATIRFIAKVDYNPMEAFIPVAQATTYPLVMAITAKIPPTNIKEFVEYAKTRPGEINIAVTGFGADYLLSLLFQREAGIKFKDVQYKGNAESTVDLINGLVHVRMDAWGGVKPLQDEGKLRAIAIGPKERSVIAPGVPTFVESGYSGATISTLTALYAPTGTPQAIVDKISADVKDALAKPEVIEKLKGIGLAADYAPSSQLLVTLKSLEDRIGKLTAELNIVPQ